MSGNELTHFGSYYESFWACNGQLMRITSTKCHKVEPKCVWAESIPDSEKRNVVVLLYFLHLGPLVELRSLAVLLQAQHLWRVIIYCSPDCLDSTSDLCPASAWATSNTE